MAVIRLVAPAAEPLLPADCRSYCRVGDEITDSVLNMLIAGAREKAESLTRRRLITQQWRQLVDGFPAEGDVRLQVPPVASVQSVTYVDADGAWQTLSSSSYVLDAAVEPGWLQLAYGASWPGTRAVANAVRIDMTSGYGASGASVPPTILQWMYAAISFWVDNPGAFDLSGRASALPHRFHERLLDEHIVYGI